MNILIAPNTFKGSLSNIQAAECIKNGMLEAASEEEVSITLSPIADGGDNSLEVIASNHQLTWMEVPAFDALGRALTANYAILKDGSAFIEMAKVSGLAMIDEADRDAGKSSSFGTGLMIKHAIESGCRKIYLAVGGTASTDGGAGILQALGFELIDKDGKDIPLGGSGLLHLEKILLPDKPDLLRNISFEILCDVSNPLLGEQGAAKVFSPQKGAGDQLVEKLEMGMEHFAGMIKKDFGKQINQPEFSGAAGGTPAGLSAFLNVRCRFGAEVLFLLNNIEKQLKDSDLVITGEGKLDEQSFQGKAPYLLSKLCRKHGKTIIFIGGRIAGNIRDKAKTTFDRLYEISPYNISREESMLNAAEFLRNTSSKLFREIMTDLRK